MGLPLTCDGVVQTEGFRMSETNKPKPGDIRKGQDGTGKDATFGQERAAPADVGEVDSLMGLGNTGVLQKLLDDDSLALADDKSEKDRNRPEPNRAARTTGFDPYGGAMDPPEHKKKRTDLRALSAWIEKKRKMEQGGDE